MNGLGTIIGMNRGVCVSDDPLSLEDLKAKHRRDREELDMRHTRELAALPEKIEAERLRKERQQQLDEKLAVLRASNAEAERVAAEKLSDARAAGRTVWVVTSYKDYDDGGDVMAVYTREPTESEIGTGSSEEFELTD